MNKRIVLPLSISFLGLLLVGCSTTGLPIHTPPPPGLVHDQVSGVHTGLSPLYKNQLKNPPPYLKKSDHWDH